MYKSPIEIIWGEMQTQIEGDVFRVIHSYNIDADKEELIRALRYDRGQYEKGYADAKADLVRCKECRFNVANMDTDPLDATDYSDVTCSRFMTDGMRPDDFCSYGERREGE